MSRVAFNIVTYNSEATIDACLQAVLDQNYRDFSVTVVDNKSTDETAARLEQWRERGVRSILNETNQYYSRAHNQAIRATESDVVITLNPDVLIQVDYLSRVVQAFELSPKIGSVNGKLLLKERPVLTSDVLRSPPSDNAVIDGAGLMMYKSRRPYLRGNRARHIGSCLEPTYVFGVDGACGAYRRSMLEDAAIDGEYFDEDFVIYREDVDLAWRAQLLGWDSYYTPSAIGYHSRGFHLGRGRRFIPAELKRHSVKNGWLLLVKNDSAGPILRCTPYALPYQFKVALGLLTIETSSLPAITDFIGLLPAMRQKREWIQGRRRRSDQEMAHWFEGPVS